ncbi:MAG: magnesium transporter [Gemmatimonadetes bacterium]|nr:magnesium transporter [Gemmatimonadota bacterium]
METPATPDIPIRSLSEEIAAGDGARCKACIEGADRLEAVRALSRLTDDERETLLALLDPEDAAEVIEQIPDVQAVDAMEGLEPEKAARILEEFPSDEQADLLNELDQEDADAILDELTPEDAASIRNLSAYDESVAGGLMATEFLAFAKQMTVADVLRDLEKHAQHYERFNIQYSYVVEEDGALVGVLRMRSLLLARRDKTLAELMIADPIRVHDLMPMDELVALFRDNSYIGLPVVDPLNRLVGVIERSDIEHALREDADEQYRASLGIVGGEEIRTMPLRTRSTRRLAWLSINIVLNVLAASVIAFHQDTLQAVIALAVFLPIISDMSGCSGNQAVAVSMRELTLGVARPRDLLRVLGKEASVGIINGIVLGLLIGLVAYLWKGNAFLGVVVGGALALNTLLAVSIGGAVPLILKGFKLDPALASGPILTTITDMCGFFLVLTFASMFLARLI